MTTSLWVVQLTVTSYCIVIASASALYFLLRRENKMRAQLPEDQEERDRLASKDLTDKENKYFRYVM